jgi:hypothetical protein
MGRDYELLDAVRASRGLTREQRLLYLISTLQQLGVPQDVIWPGQPEEHGHEWREQVLASVRLREHSATELHRRVATARGRSTTLSATALALRAAAVDCRDDSLNARAGRACQ